MLKSILTALFGFLAVAPHLTAAELSPAETTQLLAKLQEHRAKFPSLTAEFTEEKTTHLLNKPLVSQGTLAFLAPNRFKRELRGNNPSTMISNGQRLWIYYPKFNAAELYTLGQRAFFDDAIEALTAGLNFQHVSEFYRASASHETDGYRLTLVPKSGGVKRILKDLTVYLDDEYKIEKTVAILPKGDEVVTVYRNQRPAPVPASMFDFTPPTGATVSQPLGK